ncbi:F-box only protein 34 isoform X2 [Gouania willdenowi]|nr:F-box only protein 34-like isoform X2 [Gouania willdenowi]XP_028294736.1 F-box only protein 34-like isoform X2 [Gouania willdenowi]
MSPNLHQGGLCSSNCVLNTTNTLCSAVTTIRLKAPPPAAVHLLAPPTVGQDTDTVQSGEDVWTLVRPGHVREKIAIFTPEGGNTGSTHSGSIKRQRRSKKLSRDEAPPFLSSLPWQPVGEEGEPQVSVGEMVAFLEQRVSEPRSKPLALQRSSTSITLSRAPPTDATGPDGSRVQVMVARLEGEEGVSRRAVCRVLLAAAAHREPISSQMKTDTPVQAPPFSFQAVNQFLPSMPQEADPLPGLLFLTTETRPLDSSQSGKRKRSEQTGVFIHQAPPPFPQSVELLSGLLFLTNEPRPPANSSSQSRGQAVSPDFLEVRGRVQALLERPSFLWLLPPHLLLHVLRLLPTRSLAALKCTCSYLRLLIEAYGVRPADSLWVSDPRYRDDPCKQCKRRYVQGDMSLCCWHAKPYCQALPSGPGYWMCCFRPHRDAPGCRLGLHDNRWVPPFHSINAPLHRRATVE